jgi:hypothetical protein
MCLLSERDIASIGTGKEIKRDAVRCKRKPKPKGNDKFNEIEIIY